MRLGLLKTLRSRPTDDRRLLELSSTIPPLWVVLELTSVLVLPSLKCFGLKVSNLVLLKVGPVAIVTSLRRNN